NSMPTAALADLLDPVRAMPGLSSLTPELLLLSGETDQVPQFLAEALPLLTHQLAVDFAAVVAPQSGDWQTLGAAGSRQRLPVTLLADALDRESTVADANWLIVPIGQRGAGEPQKPGFSKEAGLLADGHLLAIYSARGGWDKVKPAALALAPVIGRAISQIQQRHRERHRIRRLEAILEIAGQWNQLHEMVPLLTQMAEAATKLIEADRASIFLWDRPNHILVGRPALGVEGNELRIPDDKGLVGRVVQT